MGEGAERVGNELSRSFLADASLPFLCIVGTRQTGCERAEGLHRFAGGGISSRLQKILCRLRHWRFAEAAGFESIGGGHSGCWTLWFWKEQEGSANHNRVFHQRDSRDGWGECAGGRQG